MMTRHVPLIALCRAKRVAIRGAGVSSGGIAPRTRGKD